MRTLRVITALAAVAGLALSFAPFLGLPVDTRRLSQFSADQPPAFWFGRAAILLLVIAAVVAMKSLRLAAGCAVVAAVAISTPVVITPLRQVVSLGWTAYVGAPVPPRLPMVDASPQWGLGALLAVATFMAGELILAMTRSADDRVSLRVAGVGLLVLGALLASLALVDAEMSSGLGGPRRFADYVAVPSDASFGDANRWFAVGSVVLIVLAAAAALFPFSAPLPDRSNR